MAILPVRQVYKNGMIPIYPPPSSESRFCARSETWHGTCRPPRMLHPVAFYLMPVTIASEPIPGDAPVIICCLY
ncbi:MAG: hypothetical protein KME19_04325 [Microcoleus vaginatus WJT46-NPBG5]|nr:hypothetical protein [Microcoleus vaginatus WJT46-NPBG5]